MDFNYKLLEETKKEIKNMRFFREVIEINAEEYEIIHDYDEAFENAFDREYEELEDQTWVDNLEENMANVMEIIYQHDNYAELSNILRSIKIPELDDIEYTIEDYIVKEEIHNEIELCAKSRFVCGKENVFLRVYLRHTNLEGGHVDGIMAK